MLKYCCLLFLFVYQINCQTYNENTYFINSAVLVQPDAYVVSWNNTDTDIFFKVVAKTNGWVGFGISPNGGMENSDMVVVYTASNGVVSFQDSHTESSKTVLADSAQNWKQLFYSNAAGVTTVIFTRKLKICTQVGTEVNINIESTSYAIYAWGTGTPSYHGSNRGTRSLLLLGSLTKKVEIDMTGVETVDFKVNTTLPNDRETTYFCQMFKIPADWLTTKRHIIRQESLIDKASEPYVHHWLMYECSASYEVFLRNNSMPPAGICAGAGQLPEWDVPNERCNKISLAWAVGAKMVLDFPTGFAYPVGGGGAKEFKYFFLQMHYENANRVQNVQENSGLRLYVTKNLQATEFGVFTGGTSSNPSGIMIPPKMKKLNLEYQCRKQNMNQIYGSNDNVTIFASLPHTHYAGRQVFSKIVRDSKEIAYIANNQYYDFAYQYTNFLQKPVVMKRNDEFIMNCVYNTEDRTKTTYGGLGTYDEMCLNFVWYYPRNPNLEACYDFPTNEAWYYLFDGLNKTGQIDWNLNTGNTRPNAFFQDSMMAIENSNLTAEFLEPLFQDFYDNADRYEYMANQPFAQYDPIKVERIVSDPCVDVTTNAPTTTKSDNLFNSADDRLRLRISLPIVFGSMAVLLNLH